MGDSTQWILSLSGHARRHKHVVYVSALWFMFLSLSFRPFLGGNFLYLVFSTPIIPLKLRVKCVFLSLKRGRNINEMDGGEVAQISTPVGNLSHINLTPNFHTCTAMCCESQ